MKKDKKEILRQDIESYLEKRAEPRARKKGFSFSGFFKKSSKIKGHAEKSLADSLGKDFESLKQGKEYLQGSDSQNPIMAEEAGQGPMIAESANPGEENAAQMNDGVAKESDDGYEQIKKDSMRLIEIEKLLVENLDERQKSRLEGSKEFKNLKEACQN
ncbi:MAG TPA: hypothetical protein VI564_03980 [Candidatus Nanoarchaeia archaeon]|nr:hypothetical protein [Candidatus Nanoarchaeia archaeon]